MARKQAKEYRVVLGQDLACTICRHKKFWLKDVQMNTSFMTLLGLDWLNPSATCYICESCGYVHWFMPK